MVEQVVVPGPKEEISYVRLASADAARLLIDSRIKETPKVKKHALDV